MAARVATASDIRPMMLRMPTIATLSTSEMFGSSCPEMPKLIPINGGPATHQHRRPRRVATPPRAHARRLPGRAGASAGRAADDGRAAVRRDGQFGGLGTDCFYCGRSMSGRTWRRGISVSRFGSQDGCRIPGVLGRRHAAQRPVVLRARQPGGGETWAAAGWRRDTRMGRGAGVGCRHPHRLLHRTGARRIVHNRRGSRHPATR